MTAAQKTADIAPASFRPTELSPDEVDAALREYVANPVFRSARYEELVIDDNPYRRPVRPEDLEWLRFDEPLTRATYSQLTGLLGHRMLLNIYDSHRPLLPAQMTADKWREFDLFYGPDNMRRGEKVRPFLEYHVFDFVTRTTDELDLDNEVHGPAAVNRLLARVAAERESATRELTTVVDASGDGERATRMLAIQVLAGTLNAPLQISPALVSEAVAASRQARPLSSDGGSARTGRAGRALAELIDGYGLGGQAHEYYQFYLPSTLAAMNYLNATRHDHAKVFAFLGAMAARTIDTVALAGGFGGGGELVAGFGGGELAAAAVAGCPVAAPNADLEQALSWLAEQVVRPIGEQYGKRALRQFARGVADYATLLDVHRDDLTTQLRWIDAAQEHRAKGDRLQAAIDEHQIPVHLDTFVESWEECSTTHVHDDDRLVVIESGEMEFWNCFGDRHKFVPGDKFFVPKHRLHGSVVLSGVCVYHQPVITPELNERYG
ncbi:MAG TPA: hypothetical protein VHA75_07580 [Rugosimonospora sp.]|nr:hypothetical protein [Rugosimonospora sp.]